MNHDPKTSIVITDGYWMHIRHTRIYHRHYPELRGEGRTLADAASHLVDPLARLRRKGQLPSRQCAAQAVRPPEVELETVLAEVAQSAGGRPTKERCGPSITVRAAVRIMR